MSRCRSEGGEMKHGKRPTVRQLKLMRELGINNDSWLVERETPDELVIVHRLTDKTRTIRKEMWK